MDNIELLFLKCVHIYARHNEAWLPVKGFPNYEVSSQGRVRNIKTKKVLKPHKRSDGYITVVFQRKQKFVHRIVCLAFWPKLLIRNL